MSPPLWQRVAESGYALVLKLYPRSTRERHGEEMRQAFRDRCREAGEGRISPWRLLGAELAPDLATSLATAHLEEPLMPRVRLAIVGFAVLACAWFFHDAISKRFLDAYFTASLHYQHWNDDRAFTKDEARVRALADSLASSPDDTKRSVAALLYATNVANVRYAESMVIGTPERMSFEIPEKDLARASQLLVALGKSRNRKAARMTLAACALLPDCDRLAKAETLARLEPENAFGWSEVLTLHSIAGNEAGVRADLHNIGLSRYYDDGMAEAWQAVWSAASMEFRGQADAFGALGRQLLGARAMPNQPYEHGVMYRCSLAKTFYLNSPRWRQANLSGQPECGHVAVVLANSNDPWASRWGWNWLNRSHPSQATQSGLKAAEYRLQHLGSFGGTTPTRTGYWRPWTDEEWMAWATAKPGAN
jgi:hypothetical protein